MRTRQFGKTGIQVSEIGFGAWAIGGVKHTGYGPTRDSDSVAALKKAADLGVNFFDTADVYGHGHSEELVGQTFKGNARKDLIIASKVGYDFYGAEVKPNFDPAYILSACEKSLRRLQTETIDVYQLHNLPMDEIKKGAALEALRQLKKQGKIRVAAISIGWMKPEEALEAIRQGAESIQIVYNLLHSEMGKDVFRAAEEAGTAVIVREPLERGILTGRYTKTSTFHANDIRSKYKPEQFDARVRAAQELKEFLVHDGVKTLAEAALRYTLVSKAVSTVIPGGKTPQQVEQNCRVSDDYAMGQDDLARIAEWRKTFTLA